MKKFTMYRVQYDEELGGWIGNVRAYAGEGFVDAMFDEIDLGLVENGHPKAFDTREIALYEISEAYARHCAAVAREEGAR